MRLSLVFPLFLVVVPFAACTCGDPPGGEGEGEGQGSEGEGEGSEGEGEGGEGEGGEGEGGPCTTDADCADTDACTVDRCITSTCTRLPAFDPACGAPTTLCDRGWCWENPVPHGMPLSAVWPVSSTSVWVGGDQGGLSRWDGSVFTHAERPVAFGIPVGVSRLWGSSADDVWGAGGTIIHWDGSAWSVDTIVSSLGVSVRDVHGFGPDDVWAVGSAGRALHWDGIGWSVFETGAAETLAAVHGQTPNDVWAVGISGKVVHWDGTSWAVVAPVPSQTATVSSIFELAPDDVWVAGDVSVMWHFDGATWASTPAVANRRLGAVWAASPDDVWAGGDFGTVARWNGSTWAVVASFGQSTFLGMRGRAADDIWAVGIGGLVAHYDGTSWERAFMPSRPVEANLVDVTAVAGPEGPVAYAVGGDLSGGVIARRDPNGVWQEEPGITSQVPLTNIYALAPDDIWAQGPGIRFHFDGTSWTQGTIPGGFSVYAPDGCATSPDEHWLVGLSPGVDEARIYKGNGTSFTLDAAFRLTNDPLDLSHVWCLADGEVWAGGEKALVRHEADGWRRIGADAILEGGLLLDAYAASPESVWIVSADEVWNDGSTIVRFDGREWTEVLFPDPAATRQMRAVDGTGPSNVWLVGSGGAWRFDGASFAPVDMPVAGGGSLPAFVAVRVFTEDNVVLLDANFSLWRFDGISLAQIGDGDSVAGDPGAVYIAAPDDAWVLSNTFGATIHHWDGTQWTSDFRFPLNDGLALHGFAPDDIWAVGDQLEVAHWDGTTWTATELSSDPFPSESLVSVWGATPDDLWAVGTRGSVWRNTGAGFLQVVQPETDTARFVVVGAAADDVWLAGRTGVFDSTVSLEHVDAAGPASRTRWETLRSPVHIQRVGDRTLAVDGFSGVWELGASGWQEVVAPLVDPDDLSPNRSVVDAWFTGPNEGFLVGSSTWIFDGTSLVDQAGTFGFYLPGRSFGGMPAAGDSGGDPGSDPAGAGHVWAVGANGTVIHHAPAP